MPIGSIVVKNDTLLQVRYNITGDTLDNKLQTERILLTVLGRIPEQPQIYTFKFRETDKQVWKYSLWKENRRVGGAYVRFSSWEIVQYDVQFFWDIPPPIQFTRVSW